MTTREQYLSCVRVVKSKHPPMSHALTLGERWRIWQSRQKEDANANPAQRRT